MDASLIVYNFIIDSLPGIYWCEDEVAVFVLTGLLDTAWASAFVKAWHVDRVGEMTNGTSLPYVWRCED